LNRDGRDERDEVTMERSHLEALATKVLDAAFEVHRELGPGLLEST
jgi:hypothetical protein